MPVSPTYPGLYIEELPSGVRTITGVSTSNTAFVGYFRRGKMDEPLMITNFGDFERAYGGLDKNSDTSYAIRQYFLNGGSIAWVVRVAGGLPVAASGDIDTNGGGDIVLTVMAKNEGTWGDNLMFAAEGTGESGRFSLFVREVDDVVSSSPTIITQEQFMNLSIDDDDSRFVETIVNGGSLLINVSLTGTSGEPTEGTFDSDGNPTAFTGMPSLTGYSGGADGTAPGDTDIIGSLVNKTGMYSLENIAPEIFNILCIPETASLADPDALNVITAATTYCETRRAVMLVDVPASYDSLTLSGMITGIKTWVDDKRNKNTAVYFPRLEIGDPLNGNEPKNIAASGTLAGIFARTDATRGVWKAPAGIDADLRGARPAKKLSDDENGVLNTKGINVIRSFPVYGNIGWGARTLVGADAMASEWKYIPVRRTALFIEETLYQNLKWVVFEPNDEGLWSQIRMNVGAFMQGLFRQGAFQGTSSRDAYLVKCDSETTTQNDINLGIVNILVGFAPLKPAEFVIIKIQQLAGQVEA